MKRAFLLVLLILVVAVVTYKYFYPTYNYRYRLTINIEADGKIHSGSSVIEVIWYAHFLPETISFSSVLRGQAALVDLGDRGVVVAALINGESYGPASDGAWGAQWIAARSFGFQSTLDQLSALQSMRGKRDLGMDNLPRFVWLSDPRDPKSAKKILVQDFPTLLGPSVRFAGAFVEITDDPLVIDIRNKLPWLKALERRPAGDDVIYLPDNFPISRSLFIGDWS